MPRPDQDLERPKKRYGLNAPVNGSATPQPPRYLSNSAWLLASNLLSSVLGLLVVAVIARILGPEEFGYYVYVFSLAALFAALGHLGLDGLMVREIVEAGDRDRQVVVMGTAGTLRIAGYAIGALLCLGAGMLLPEQTATETWLFVTASMFVLLSPLPIIPEIWLRAQAEARFGAKARIVGTLLGSGAKVGLVLAGYGVLWVGVMQVGTVVIVLLVMIPVYLWRGGPAIRTLRFDWAVAKSMLKESWQIFAGSLLAVIYLKIDLVMLRWYYSPEEVGIYSVAARLSEVPYILAGAIVTATFPRLIELRKIGSPAYGERLQTMFHVMSVLAILIIGLIALLGPFVIGLTFGPMFAPAGTMLMIHMLAMPFIFMRYVFSRWIIMEKFAVFSIYSQGAGALANVALNLILIPVLGGIGAAIATVVSYATASYLVLIFSGRTRPIFLMMTRALFMPWKALTDLNLIRKNRVNF